MQYNIELKRFRQMFNLTQKQAAEHLGIEQQQWQRYETLKNEFPLRYLITLCTKFNISADWLLGLTDTPPNPR